MKETTAETIYNFCLTIRITLAIKPVADLRSNQEPDAQQNDVASRPVTP